MSSLQLRWLYEKRREARASRDDDLARAIARAIQATRAREQKQRWAERNGWGRYPEHPIRAESDQSRLVIRPLTELDSKAAPFHVLEPDAARQARALARYPSQQRPNVRRYEGFSKRGSS